MDIPGRFLPAIFFLVFIVFPHQSAADIYKCLRADGSVGFSDIVCANGSSETVGLHENSALDSTAERQNIEAYKRQVAGGRALGNMHGPQIVLLGDSRTAQRNARVTEQEKLDASHIKSHKKTRSRSHATHGKPAKQI
ncbi:MAG TPA: hypothetical protein PLF22_10400 [Pseudomonadales bacterium]|nr:hypothetical protein [Pseudomonadales bacterium]